MSKHLIAAKRLVRMVLWVMVIAAASGLSLRAAEHSGRFVSEPEAPSKDAPRRPNVILILADDLGYGDLQCYGHPRFRTPYLDQMAADGIRLTQFNTPAPFCAPTRASLLTGRYPMRCGMPGNPAPDATPRINEIHLDETEVTLAELLKSAGYATAIFGKWHLGHARAEWLPTHHGFDEYFGIPYSNDMRPVALFEGDQKVEYPVQQAMLTERYTTRALDFIDRNQHQPFFLYLPHAMPHKPLAASPQFYGKSGAGLYGDVISELDASVGRILARLKELQLDQDTLVVFTSDNGAWYGGSTAGLRGMKSRSYEGAYRVPCIARWPGTIPAGQVSNELCVTMDLFATALAAAGVQSPADRTLDGQNLLPLMTEQQPVPRRVIFGQQGNAIATVRDQRWKLHVVPPSGSHAATLKPGTPWKDPRGPDGTTILAPLEQHTPDDHPGVTTGAEPKAMQLFDLQNDPSEQVDVTDQYPEIVRSLKADFDQFLSGLPVAAASAGTQVKTAPASSPPNIIVFLADDLGYGDLACYGHPVIQTPHLDRFASQGVRFTQCYSASAVCSPSR